MTTNEILFLIISACVAIAALSMLTQMIVSARMYANAKPTIDNAMQTIAEAKRLQKLSLQLMRDVKPVAVAQSRDLQEIGRHLKEQGRGLSGEWQFYRSEYPTLKKKWNAIWHRA